MGTGRRSPPKAKLGFQFSAANSPGVRRPNSERKCCPLQSTRELPTRGTSGSTPPAAISGPGHGALHAHPGLIWVLQHTSAAQNSYGEPTEDNLSVSVLSSASAPRRDHLPRPSGDRPTFRTAPGPCLSPAQTSPATVSRSSGGHPGGDKEREGRPSSAIERGGRSRTTQRKEKPRNTVENFGYENLGTGHTERPAKGRRAI